MRRVVLVIFAALLFLPIIIESRKNSEAPVLAAFSPLTSARISVKISGDVHHSGIYQLPVNAVASSVIKMAEPLRPLPQLENIPDGLRLLQNGSAVKLSIHPSGAPLLTVGLMTVPERLAFAIPLDIAAMNAADFERLPGIGPALAKRIIAHRHNNGGLLRVSDLLEVEGIGQKRYEMLCPLFNPL